MSRKQLIAAALLLLICTSGLNRAQAVGLPYQNPFIEQVLRRTSAGLCSIPEFHETRPPNLTSREWHELRMSEIKNALGFLNQFGGVRRSRRNEKSLIVENWLGELPPTEGELRAIPTNDLECMRLIARYDVMKLIKYRVIKKKSETSEYLISRGVVRKLFGRGPTMLGRVPISYSPDRIDLSVDPRKSMPLNPTAASDCHEFIRINPNLFKDN